MPTEISGSTGVNKIQDDTVVAADIASSVPLGKVLQVVQGHATAAVVASSTSWAASTLSATITPSATSSKILIDLTAWLQLNGSGVHGVFTIYRDSTNLGGSYGFGDYYGGSAGFTEITQAASYLDSPSSTSAITYKFYIRTQGSGTVTTGTTGSRVESITLTEIAG